MSTLRITPYEAPPHASGSCVSLSPPRGGEGYAPLSRGEERRRREGFLHASPSPLKEQCDDGEDAVAPHSSRSNVLVRCLHPCAHCAALLCFLLLFVRVGMAWPVVALRCGTVRVWWHAVSTAPVCRQFSGGRPASPVVA